MDAHTLGTAAAIGGPILLGLVWLIRLEGRVNIQEALHKGLHDDVQYIRERIDAALNGHGK